MSSRNTSACIFSWKLSPGEFLKNVFSQEDAESLVGDYLKHQQHVGGKPLTDGSSSPGCMKVGEAHVLNLTLILSYLPRCCSGQQQRSEMSCWTCFSGVSEDAKRSLRWSDPVPAALPVYFCFNCPISNATFALDGNRSSLFHIQFSHFLFWVNP